MAVIRGPAYPVQLRTWIDSPLTLLSGAPAAVPFMPQFWPMPVRDRYLQRDWAWPLNPNLYGGGAKPFLQSDWPNPVRRGPWPQWQPAPDLLANTLFVAPAKPFLQSSWPNPLGYLPTVLRQHRLATNPNLFPPAEAADIWTPVTEATPGWSAVSADGSLWTEVPVSGGSWVEV